VKTHQKTIVHNSLLLEKLTVPINLPVGINVHLGRPIKENGKESNAPFGGKTLGVAIVFL